MLYLLLVTSEGKFQNESERGKLHKLALATLDKATGKSAIVAKLEAARYDLSTLTPDDRATLTAPPEPRLFWYVVTGRIPGDEDSAMTFHTTSKEDAMDEFREEMHRDLDMSLDAIAEEYGETLIINHVFQSNTEITAR
ncbi:MAG: hypothetical protein EBS21_10750 [Sphingomonadaceae bacterium]|nr:hypothetical protein [Sphingomonadaceae bacterium]